jgi:cytochrome c oxidase accessory protein FixG
MRLDRQGWSPDKLLRKSGKHLAWAVVALWTGFTFVGYFTPVRDLAREAGVLGLGSWEWFWVMFYGFATYGNAGWMREQVCKYMCPYARFQSAMFDRDSLIVTYDAARGEPRSNSFQKTPAPTSSPCIDCSMCVQVCPTGIDIRDGLQIECIGCAACIDACDSIMDKMDYPRGLISYTTEHNLSGQKTHKLRPRLIGYALVLLTMMGLLAGAFFMRSLVGFDVSKDRVLYRENAEGRIENVYSLKIMNKDQRDHTYVLEASGLPELKLQGKREIKVAAGEIFSQPVELSMAPEKLPSSTNEVKFTLKDADDNSVHVEAKSRFIGPQIR